MRDKCRFRGYTCHNCGKIGHLQQVCGKKSLKTKLPFIKKGQIKTVKEDSEYESEDDYGGIATIMQVGPGKKDPLKLNVSLDDKPLCMELDTGASVSLVSNTTFKNLFGNRNLRNSDLTLRTYSGELLNVLGEVEMLVVYKNQKKSLPLVVVEGEGPSLFGRDWLAHFKLNWHEIKSIRNEELSDILKRANEVFQHELGELKGCKATIHVDPKATPRFCKARPVPYAMREKVDHELDKLVEEGVLEPVENAEWAAPIVSVRKPDKKSVRICGDFKQTVNRAPNLIDIPFQKLRTFLRC